MMGLYFSILWPAHAKSWLTGKDSDAGRDWGQEEKGTTEDEMAGWHHWLDGRESGWTPGVGDGQGGLACCDSWCRKESDTTEQLNWTDPLGTCMCSRGLFGGIKCDPKCLVSSEVEASRARAWFARSASARWGDSRHKSGCLSAWIAWYHMVFVFLFLTYFT